jgi:[ribosomal protein S18]-alanine N-acetyltransferase
MRFRVEPMHVEHISAVATIERRCFSQPWPSNAYRKEIQGNRMAHYFIVRHLDAGTEPGSPDCGGERAAAGVREERRPVAALSPTSDDGILGKLSRLFRGPNGHPSAQSPAAEAEPRSIVGYAGLWLMSDEAHITTLAVDPDYQGHGIGELLLLGLIDRAKQIGARWLTLEVRVSNEVAQQLYRKYTFKQMGVRRRYYSDNGEDALVMWTDPIDSDRFQEALRENREALGRKLGQHD